MWAPKLVSVPAAETARLRRPGKQSCLTCRGSWYGELCNPACFRTVHLIDGGAGMKTETVISSTQSVTMPVSGLSGSESMKVLLLGDTLNPLSPTESYNISA